MILNFCQGKNRIYMRLKNLLFDLSSSSRGRRNNRRFWDTSCNMISLLIPSRNLSSMSQRRALRVSPPTRIYIGDYIIGCMDGLSLSLSAPTQWDGEGKVGTISTRASDAS